MWQWIFLFLIGFFISRLVASAGIAGWLLGLVIRKTHGSVPWLLGSIVLAAVLLSLLTPNVFAALTLLGFLERLQQGRGLDPGAGSGGEGSHDTPARSGPGPPPSIYVARVF